LQGTLLDKPITEKHTEEETGEDGLRYGASAMQVHKQSSLTSICNVLKQAHSENYVYVIICHAPCAKWHERAADVDSTWFVAQFESSLCALEIQIFDLIRASK
jgi:hypothetical protein